MLAKADEMCFLSIINTRDKVHVMEMTWLCARMLAENFLIKRCNCLGMRILYSLAGVESMHYCDFALFDGG